MMTTKTHSSNHECCMCGDLGLSHELFRCKVCRFRSQHRYCSNLYPKAESYRVCNWCLIHKDDDRDNLASPTTTSYPNSNSPENRSSAKKHLLTNHHHTPTSTLIGSKSPKCLQPTSSIKKPTMVGSPSARKRTTAQTQAQQEAEKLIRRTKSEEIVNGNKRMSPSSGGPGPGQGPAVIKHVFRNKVRRYKLLDEFSS